MKIIIYQLTFLILPTLFTMSSCLNTAESEIHLIPREYKGPVIIIFNEKNGVPEKYENGSRVYEIPTNGILRTRFRQQKRGYIAPDKVRYYYYNGRSRSEIIYLQSTQNINDDGKNYVFGKELSQKTVRYLVGEPGEGDAYFNALRKKIDEIFPQEVQ